MTITNDTTTPLLPGTTVRDKHGQLGVITDDAPAVYDYEVRYAAGSSGYPKGLYYRHELEPTTETDLTSSDLSIGDEVRLVHATDKAGVAQAALGKTGTVLGIYRALNLVSVDFDPPSGRGMILLANRLELVKKAKPNLKVGDRVRVICERAYADPPYYPDMVGETGTVTRLYEDGKGGVYVEGDGNYLGYWGAQGLELIEDESPRVLKVGDKVESVEELRSLNLCAVVVNQFGAVFVKNTTSDEASEPFTSWFGVLRSAEELIFPGAELTLAVEGITRDS